jgi:hypothetical protein
VSWFAVSRFVPGADPLAPALLLHELVALGGGCGLLVGAAAASLLERRGAAVLAWGVWCGLAAAAGAGLSGGAAAALGDTLPPVIGSALGFSAAGLLVGLGGRLWYVRRPRPAGTPPRAAPPWTVRGAAAWALAGAGIAAASYAVGTALGEMMTGVDFPGGLYAGDVSRAAATGGGSGLLVGVIAGACFGTRGRGFSNRPEAALVCGAGAAVAVAIGGALSAYAVTPLAGVLPAGASSALGFSVSGLLLGLGGYALPRPTPPPFKPEDEEESVSKPGAGKAAIGTRRTRPGFAWPGLRFLPALGVSLGALVAAPMVGSPGAAVALLAVGLLGLSVVPVLWNQERRLRELERRFRGEPRFTP